MTVISVTVSQVEYTLDELVAAVAARLAAAGIDRQDNGQVSAFPDRRTLRYYTTIGLMDRPDTVRNRQAIYGERHVTQAVAVKRLQASGLPLAAIQARLAGLPSDAVDAIAAGRAEAVFEVPGSRQGFWALPAAASTVFATGGPAPPGAMAAAGPGVGPGVAGAGSSRAMAGAGSPVTAAAAPAAETGSRAASRRMAAADGPAAPAPAPALDGAPDGPAAPAPPPNAAPAPDIQPMVAVRLSADTTLLLTADRSLSAHDVSAIREAAATLLSHLAAAGLTGATDQRRERR
jgi:DNA-binding transcriptional MerR regulator